MFADDFCETMREFQTLMCVCCCLLAEKGAQFYRFRESLVGFYFLLCLAVYLMLYNMSLLNNDDNKNGGKREGER